MKLITLTKGYFTKVDEDWYDYLNQWSWYYHEGYARRDFRDETTGKRVKVLMHRIINNTPEGMDTDHVDTDGLNNQSNNLRSASKKENSRNRNVRSDSRLGVKGVTTHKNKYKAVFSLEGKSIYLGLFDTLIEAKQAHDESTRAAHGKFFRE